MKVSTSVAGILVGVLVAPFALLLAIISAGAGHGHYVAAKLWFPFTMVSTYFLGSITTPFVALAVFPISHLRLARGNRGGRQESKNCCVGC